MSYILEALRRADADRERGTVPDIRAQPVLLVSADALATARAKTWGAIAAIALLGLIIAVGWIIASRQVTPETVPPIAASTVPRVATTQTTDRPASAVDTVAATNSEPESTRRAEQPARRPSRSTTRLPAKTTGTANRVLAFKELPAGIQRALPKLLIGGSVYSKDAASRFLMVNGQLFHEGDKVAPDLTLEAIKLKAAVFKYKTYRYELEY